MVIILVLYFTAIIISYYWIRYIARIIYKGWDWTDIFGTLILSTILPILSALVWTILCFTDLKTVKEIKPPKWL